jgi:hypothetical protein
MIRMASQRLLLIAIGGDLAAAIWRDVCVWNDARASKAEAEWTPHDWPPAIHHEVDRFVDRIRASALFPPVLYRAEHVDTWSMGDIFETALVKSHRDYTRRLNTHHHEIIATWVRFSEHIMPDRNVSDETRWLYNRANEAMDAWRNLAENRLLVLVRSVIGATWSDEEVEDSLRGMPSWYVETEQG